MTVYHLPSGYRVETAELPYGTTEFATYNPAGEAISTVNASGSDRAELLTGLGLFERQGA